MSSIANVAARDSESSRAGSAAVVALSQVAELNSFSAACVRLQFDAEALPLCKLLRLAASDDVEFVLR